MNAEDRDETLFVGLSRRIYCFSYEKLMETVVDAVPYYCHDDIDEEVEVEDDVVRSKKPKRIDGTQAARFPACSKLLSFAAHGLVAGIVGVTALHWKSPVTLSTTTVSQLRHLYTSADGMQLVLHGPMPMKWLQVRVACCITLLFGTLVQKQLLPSTRFLQRAHCASDKQVPYLTATRARRLHEILGGLTIGSMVGMTTASIAWWRCMPLVARDKRHSIAFMAMLALPWCILLPAVGITRATATVKRGIVHAVIGVLAIKTTIAMPLACWIAAGIQRYRRFYVVAADVENRLGRPNAVDEMARQLSNSYYHGILVSIAVVGLWALVDTALLIRSVLAKSTKAQQSSQAQDAPTSASVPPRTVVSVGKKEVARNCTTSLLPEVIAPTACPNPDAETSVSQSSRRGSKSSRSLRTGKKQQHVP